jgi:hypothetical protein
VLQGVGRRVQVYVAIEDAQDVSSDVVTDVIRTFDERIYPDSAPKFGTARDVDGDGRFTVLFSSWLGHLGGGRYAVDGFVRGADLDSSFDAPLGNRCDVMYLNPALQAGPHLRTVVAHEYMHAVIFSQKTLRTCRGQARRVEEEGWLDEAMAHLAEDDHAFTGSNIDYRASAFLSWPEHYQLVVDDYYAADLFRSHGSRGSTYLFLRWCADRYGTSFLPALVHSSARGVANLEAATGSSFAALFRRWSVALYLSGLATEVDARDPLADHEGFLSYPMRGPHEEWELAGPRFARVSPGGPTHRFSVVGTSPHFVVVDGSKTSAVEIQVDGPPEAELQVTALPLGSDLARLELSLRKSRGSDGALCMRAHLRELHGVPVRLSAVSWEPLEPVPNPRAGGFHCNRLDMPGIASRFGTSAVPALGELWSRPIPLSVGPAPFGSIIVKVVGTDANGRRVTAWAGLDSDAIDP